MTKNLIFKAYVNLEFQYTFFSIIFLISPFKSMIGYCQICSVTYCIHIDFTWNLIPSMRKKFK